MFFSSLKEARKDAALKMVRDQYPSIAQHVLIESVRSSTGCVIAAYVNALSRKLKSGRFSFTTRRGDMVNVYRYEDKSNLYVGRDSCSISFKDSENKDLVYLVHYRGVE